MSLVGWLGAVASLVAATLAAADGWGGIFPGQTLRREVEARYGRPTSERAVTEGGRSAPEWTYAGERAPQGLDRMVVSFGLIGPQGFTPDVVRGLTLYPKPQIFGLQAIASAWGTPDAVGTDQQTGRPAFRYPARALLIIFDPTGTWAEVLLFAPPKPAAKSPS